MVPMIDLFSNAKGGLPMSKKLFLWLPIIGMFGYALFFYARTFEPLAADSRVDKIVVIKHEREMRLISGDSVLKTYEISLGRSPKGPKEFEGDRKTPEGLYFIDRKKPEQRISQKTSGSPIPMKQGQETCGLSGKKPWRADQNPRVEERLGLDRQVPPALRLDPGMHRRDRRGDRRVVRKNRNRYTHRD